MQETTIQLLRGQRTCESVAVQTIYGVGSNYAKHIQEMNSNPATEPVIFTKPATALLSGGGILNYPKQTQNLHHEVEMVLLIGKDLWQVSQSQALEGILGVGVGLDLTLRDVQSKAKAAGRPWSIAKGFKGAAPVSAFLPVAHFANLQNISIGLSVNGEQRQQGNTQDMRFGCAEIIAYLSQAFPLRRGDLIFTGTPEGVSELKPGDNAVATLDDALILKLKVEHES